MYCTLLVPYVKWNFCEIDLTENGYCNDPCTAFMPGGTTRVLSGPLRLRICKFCITFIASFCIIFRFRNFQPCYLMRHFPAMLVLFLSFCNLALLENYWTREGT